MKILYISCHEILEYDECKLFSQLGHEVFSLHGAYQDPKTESSKRPAIPEMHFEKYSRAMELGLQCTRENILPELLDMFDVTIFMHMPHWIISNWANLRGRRVIFRSIGQNIQQSEVALRHARSEGLQIVRYSPAERYIPGFVGSDADIRFGKDPNEYAGWTGVSGEIINFTQSMRQRGSHCGYDITEEINRHVPIALYGPGNEDISFSRGMVSHEDQRRIMAEARGYFYTGTHPASYTLNFMESWMTGIPMVAVGPRFGNPHRSGYPQDTYEVHQLVEHGVNGFVSDDPAEMIGALRLIRDNDQVAEQISAAGRQRAIELFGVETIKEQWRQFLG